MSTFTDWNGPFGRGPASSDWRDLIDNYKTALQNLNNKVDKENGKVLSSEDYTAEDKKAVHELGDASKKSIGTVASGDTGLVTGEAVYNALLGYVKVQAGYGLSENNYSNADKTAVENLLKSETVSKSVIKNVTEGDSGLVTSDAVYKAVKELTEKINNGYLKKEEFDAEAMNILKLIKSQGNIDLAFKSFSAPVAGSYDSGVYYVLGMLGTDAGTAYIRYGNTTTFAAAVNFAVTETSAQLNVIANVEASTLHNVHFFVVKGTRDGEHHNYLAISADEWQQKITDTTEAYVAKFDKVDFEGAGINFWPTGVENYVKPNGECTILADLDYRSVKDQINYVENEINNLTSVNDIGSIVVWPKYDDNGVAVDVPEWAHACDGSPVDKNLVDVIALIGPNYPLIDYHIIQIRETVSTKEAD